MMLAPRLRPCQEARQENYDLPAWRTSWRGWVLVGGQGLLYLVQDLGGDIATADDDRNGLAAIARRVLQEGGQCDRRGALDHPSLQGSYPAHGRQDFFFGDERHPIDHTPGDVQGEGFGFQASSRTFGKRGLLGEIENTPGFDRFVEHAGILRPAADDFGVA